MNKDTSDEPKVELMGKPHRIGIAADHGGCRSHSPEGRGEGQGSAANHIGAQGTHSCIFLPQRDKLDRLIQKFSREPDFQKALQIARTMCESPARLRGLGKFANHFKLATELPYWAKGKRPVAIIGRHAFYRLEHY